MEKRYVFDFSEVTTRGRSVVSKTAVGVAAESLNSALGKAVILAGRWPYEKPAGEIHWADCERVAFFTTRTDGRFRVGLRLEGVEGVVEYEVPAPTVTDVAAMPEKPTPDKTISLRAACQIGLEYATQVAERDKHDAEACRDCEKIEAALDADWTATQRDDGEKARLDELEAATSIIIEVCGGVVDSVLVKDGPLGHVEVLDYDNMKNVLAEDPDCGAETLRGMKLLEKLAHYAAGSAEEKESNWTLAYS